MTLQSQHKTINWGIIGLGSIAHKFAQDLLTVKGAKLYAVASRSQNKANSFCEKYNAIKAYDSYEGLAKDSNIDAVYIATPHALHHENTLLCLENGIAVLCEKPFAMNANQVDEMIAIAKEKKVLLMEALWTYFLPHYQFVLKTLQNKTYGNITRIESDFGFYRAFDNTARLFNKPLGGGSLLDIGIYPIFTALSTLGIPESIKAKATKFDNGVDASCQMLFNYKNDITASLKSALIQDTPTEAVFYCEKGIIKINTQFHCPTTVTITSNGKEDIIDFTEITHGYKHEIIHFNNLIRHRKTESDIMTFEFSKHLIKLLDDIRRLIHLEY